jgi:hypothetical protein
LEFSLKLLQDALEQKVTSSNLTPAPARTLAIIVLTGHDARTQLVAPYVAATVL